METKSLTLVLWQKFVAFVEDSTFWQLARYLNYILAAGILSAAWINFTAFGNFLIRLSLWHNGAVVKVAIAFVVIFAGKRIGSWFYETLFRLTFTLSGNEPPTDCIEGIPTGKLIDHLLTEGTFKGDEIEQKFTAPRYRVSKLAKKLREIGVLVTGANNAAVLADGFTADDLASIFTVPNADDLEPLFRKTDTGYTSEPSDSPTLGFSRRRITETAPAA